MAELKTQSETRKTIKKKKPLFVRRDARNKSRVPFKWRKPRGKHSPVRQKHLSRPKLVSIGYGSPKIIRYLHPSGLKEILVQNKKQLENIDPKNQGLIISKKIGNKKRIEILKLALEKKLPVINIKNPQNHLEKLELQFKKRKESKKKKFTEKEKKELEKKKKAEEKEKKEQEEKKEKNEEEKEEKLSNEGEKNLEESEISRREIEKTIIKKQ